MTAVGREFTVDFSCGIGARFNRIFDVVKAPYILLCASIADHYEPFFPAGVPANPLMSRSIAFGKRCVANVFGWVGQSEIAPPVIVADAIDVINVFIRPFTSYIKPSKPRCLVVYSAVANKPILLGSMYASGSVASHCFIRICSNIPNKYPGIRIICQYALKIFCRHSAVGGRLMRHPFHPGYDRNSICLVQDSGDK